MNEDAQMQEQLDPTESQEQPTEPQPGVTTEPFRFGSDSPEWAQGKTADEVLKMTETLYTTMQNTYSQPQPQPQMQPQTPQPMQTEGPPDPNLIYTNAAEYQRQLAAWQTRSLQEQMQMQAQPLMQGNAELAKAESKRNPAYTDVWARYGPEIEAEVAGLPLQMKLSPKFWNDAAALIKGRHAEDLFKDRLAKQNTDTGTLSGAEGFSNPKPGYASPLEKAWREDAPWIKQFKKLPGMNLSALRARVSSLGWSEADYVKHYENKVAMRIHRADEELARHGVYE